MGEKFTNILNILGVFPVRWSGKLLKFYSLLQNPTLNLIYQFRLALSWFYLFFICFQVVRNLGFGSVGITVGSMLILWLMVHLLLTLLLTASVTRASEFMVFLTQLYVLSTPDPQEGGSWERNRKLTGFHITFGVMAALNCVMLTGYFAEHPTAPYYLSSLMLSDTSCWSSITIFVVFELYHYISSWGSVLFYVYIVTSYMALMTRKLHVLRSRCGKARIDQYSVYIRFKELSIVTRSFYDVVYPLLLPGHKILVIALTIGGSYGSIHVFHLAYTNPKLYAFNVVVTLCALSFQMAWYRLSMDVHQPARYIQSHFLRMNWATLKPWPKRLVHRNLPISGGIFNILKQWLPPLFLKKIMVATMKVHFYVASWVKAA